MVIPLDDGSIPQKNRRNRLQSAVGGTRPTARLDQCNLQCNLANR